MELTEDELSLMQSSLSKRKSGKPLSGVAQDFLHALLKQNFESRKQVGSERLRSDRKPNKTNLQLLGGVSARRNLEAGEA